MLILFYFFSDSGSLKYSYLVTIHFYVISMAFLELVVSLFNGLTVSLHVCITNYLLKFKLYSYTKNV